MMGMGNAWQLVIFLHLFVVFSKTDLIGKHSDCPPNTVRLLKVMNFTSKCLRLFYVDNSTTKFQIVNAKCIKSGSSEVYISNYWIYGPNFVDFHFENFTDISDTYTLYVYFEDLDRIHCNYETSLKFRNNVTSKVEITPIICENQLFYNISWYQYGDEADTVEVTFNYELNMNYSDFTSYSENNNSIILPEVVPFPEYECKISELEWHNLNASDLKITKYIPDFIIALCNCDSNAITLTQIECYFEDYLRMGYHLKKSSTLYEITSIKVRNEISGIFTESFYHKYVPEHVDVCLNNLNYNDVYNLSLSYQDVNKKYCLYDGSLTFRLNDLNSCNHSKLTGIKKIGETNDYEIFYTSNEMLVHFENFTLICIETSTNRIVLETEVQNVTEIEKGTVAFFVNLENLELGNDYILKVAFYSNNFSCFEQSISFKVSAPTEVNKEQNYFLLLLLIPSIILLGLGYLTYSFWKTCRKNSDKLRHFSIASGESAHRTPSFEFRPRRRRSASARHIISSIYGYNHLELMQRIHRHDPFEIPREQIKLIIPIDSGAFGTVFYAKVHNLFGSRKSIFVAVKQLRNDAPCDEREYLLSEIKLWKAIGHHRHIVKMIGCVTQSQPYMLVMELILTGNLKNYLTNLREMWYKTTHDNVFFRGSVDCDYIIPEDEVTFKPDFKGGYIKRSIDNSRDSAVPDSPRSPLTNVSEFKMDIESTFPQALMKKPKVILDNKELQMFAQQIANGMAYLERIKIVHRDLATRNILITKNKILKITDFGMSKIGPYVTRTVKPLPLRWMAIEAIEQHKWTHESDVWSFGVVLWEIGTLGAFPYEKLADDDLIMFLKAGNRLPRPEICTDELYEIMLKCWSENPEDRPSFSDLETKLNENKHKAYVEFKTIKCPYELPPKQNNKDVS